MSLFVELKRRNVIRLAFAYLVASWLLIEISSAILEIYDAPGWIGQVIVALLVLGFPLTLFFAWAFEMTPEGLKRESEVDRSKSITHETGKRLDLITITMVVLIGVVLILERYVLEPAISPAVTVTGETGPSVAVLPFVNMSADAENEYFSDGVSEEILNVLSRIPSLRVVARTSSFQFRGNEHDIPLIA